MSTTSASRGLALALLLVAGRASGDDRLSKDARAELGKIARTYGIEVVATEPRFPAKTMYGVIEGRQGK